MVTTCFEERPKTGWAIFVVEDDTIVNPLGVKGMGELGRVSIPAAIANAVFHATIETHNAT